MIYEVYVVTPGVASGIRRETVRQEGTFGKDATANENKALSATA